MYVKMVAVSAILLAGCGGSAFSLGTELVVDDAGEAGDVVARVDADDAGTQVVTTDADAGKTPMDAAPEADAGQVEAQAEAAPQADAAPEDAAAEAATDAATPVCLSTLDGIGTRDFRISFTMTSTSAQTLVPLVNQRAGCNQTSVMWQALVDGYLGGKALFNMCALTGPGTCSTTGPSVSTSNPVDDGQPHRIVIRQISGVVSISSDGVIGMTSPNAYSYETFGAPLTIGTDDCGDPPLAGYGTLTDLCITSP
jgi:hypothetical protein